MNGFSIKNKWDLLNDDEEESKSYDFLYIFYLEYENHN